MSRRTEAEALHPADWVARPRKAMPPSLPFGESMLMWWAVLRLCTRRYDDDTAELRDARTWYEAQPLAARLMAERDRVETPADETDETPSWADDEVPF